MKTKEWKFVFSRPPYWTEVFKNPEVSNFPPNRYNEITNIVATYDLSEKDYDDTIQISEILKLGNAIRLKSTNSQYGDAYENTSYTVEILNIIQELNINFDKQNELYVQYKDHYDKEYEKWKEQVNLQKSAMYKEQKEKALKEKKAQEEQEYKLYLSLQKKFNKK